MIGKKSKPKANFLNVDLEIESRRKLDSLAAEMGERVFVMYCGPGFRSKRYLLTMEISGILLYHSTPDPIIDAFCDLIEKLSPAGRRIWDAAKKEFNLGFELLADELSSEFSLHPDTLQRVIRVGAGLAVTYYNYEAMKRKRDSRPA